MAILGGSVTNKFVLGNFELRVGPQELAGKLTSEHSVGIVDKFSLSSQQETVDLNALFPQEIVDTEIVSQTSQLTATIREFSHRNFNLLAGNGLPSTVKKGITGTYNETTLSASGVVLSSDTLSKAVPISKNFRPLILKAPGKSPIMFDRAMSKYDAGKLTLDASKSSYSNNANNTNTNALDTTLGYNFLYGPEAAIDSNLDFRLGYLDATITSPEKGIGVISTNATTNTYTLKIKVPSYTAGDLSDFEVTAAGVTSPKNGMSLRGKKFVLFYSTGTPATISAVAFTISTISVDSASQVLTITGVPSDSTAIPASGSTAVAYLFSGTSRTLTIANYGKFYGTLTSVTNATSGPSYSLTLPANFSNADGDYVGSVIWLDGAKTKASILKYDGTTKVAILTNSLKPAATPAFVVQGKAFTLSLRNIAFSAVLSEANDNIILPKTTSVTDKTLTVGPALVAQNVKGWVATWKDGSNLVSAEVTDIDIPEDATKNVSITLSRTPPSTSGTTSVDITLSPGDVSFGSTVITVQESGTSNDFTLLPGTQMLIYDSEDPTESQIVTVVSAEAKKDGDNKRNIQINPPLAFYPFIEGSDYKVELIDQIAFGKQTGSQYFTASLVMLDRVKGAPVVLDFWKVTLASGINLSVNPNEFASTDMVLSVLEPTREDRETTYSGIQDMVAANPLYRIAALPDAVTP